MEPASRSQDMPLPENLRPKQREVIKAFATQDIVIAKLPTGYGKTLAAAGAYAMLRHRGACNRILYVVPRTSQARQAAESVPDELAKFGVVSRAIEVGRDPMEALRRNRDNSIEVFVTTVQALQSSPSTDRTVADLMGTGRWFVIIDEHHHYANEGAWSERIKALPHCAMLAMSATPNRRDKTDHFPEPTISETYRHAADSRFVKRLVLHAYDYIVDAITVDGRSIPFRTEEIVAEVGSDSPDAIDKHMASRKMRWSPKYISPLVSYPLDRIIDLRTRGVRVQALVQAMSCNHAKMVCEQVRALLPDNMNVDWVGTGPDGRLDKDNEQILLAFCPPKDRATGRRQWTLDVLVNVGMASEGLDSMDVTEIVFLTPANITNSNLQTIGRGARRLVAKDKQVPCHVNVDTGSPMADYVGERVMELFDEVTEEDDPDERDPSAYVDDYEPLPETMRVIIVDVRLSDIRKGHLYQIALDGALLDTPPPPDDKDYEEMLAAHRAGAEQRAEDALIRYMNRASNVSSVLAQQRDLINTAVSKVAGLVIRRITEMGLPRPEKTFVGDLRRRINSQKKKLFGGVDDATDDQLRKQYDWLRNLEREILTDHGLKGVPVWLR